MAERLSALSGHYSAGISGKPGTPGVILQEIPDLQLNQVAVWPDTLLETAAMLQSHVAADSVAGPGQSSVGKTGTLLRIEPLKWWLLDAELPKLTGEQGATLDLSHARSRVSVSGPDAMVLLNLFLPLDLRPQQFPQGAVASSMIHHVGVTLWHSDQGYELFIPRGFALSLWEGLVDSALQFGLEVL